MKPVEWNPKYSDTTDLVGCCIASILEMNFSPKIGLDSNGDWITRLKAWCWLRGIEPRVFHDKTKLSSWEHYLAIGTVNMNGWNVPMPFVWYQGSVVYNPKPHITVTGDPRYFISFQLPLDDSWRNLNASDFS